jgi:hypothetical protein
MRQPQVIFYPGRAPGGARLIASPLRRFPPRPARLPISIPPYLYRPPPYRGQVFRVEMPVLRFVPLLTLRPRAPVSARPTPAGRGQVLPSPAGVLRQPPLVTTEPRLPGGSVIRRPR